MVGIMAEETSQGSSVKMRTIYSAKMPTPDPDSNHVVSDAEIGASTTSPAGVDDSMMRGSTIDGDGKGTYDPVPIQLPQSTHSLLFTEPIWSVPFAFSIAILALSITCLVLAIIDNLERLGYYQYLRGTSDMHVPANVSRAVRMAQYLAIVISLLMEEGEF